MLLVGGVNAAGVTVAAVTGDIAHHVDGFVELAVTPQGQHGRQFLAREKVGRTDSLAEHHQKSSFRRDGDAGQVSDLDRRLPDYVAAEVLAVRPHDLPQANLFGRAAQVTAEALEAIHHRYEYGRLDHGGVFRRAGGGVVEDFAQADLVGGIVQVGGFVHHDHR